MTLTMVITVTLLYVVMTERWKWPTLAAASVMALFLTIDLAFFGANALKITHGGWLPLAIGWFLFTLMTTWKTGRQLVAARLTARAIPIEEFLGEVDRTRPARAPHRAGGATTRRSAARTHGERAFTPRPCERPGAEEVLDPLFLLRLRRSAAPSAALLLTGLYGLALPAARRGGAAPGGGGCKWLG